MKSYKKKILAVHEIRKLLEPGPIVLVSSQYKGESNIMTLGWQTVLEFSPSLVGLMISSGDHSYDLIRKSKECVINIPEVHLLRTAVDIGNCTGRDIDKFSEFGLTAESSSKVKAPRIKECYANIECRLKDAKLIKSYNFFIFEAVHAMTAISPKNPKTFHYQGDGQFMIAGAQKNMKRYFKPHML